MATLQRGTEDWNALADLVKRFGTADVLRVVAAINRDTMPEHPVQREVRSKMCRLVEDTANRASRIY